MDTTPPGPGVIDPGGGAPPDNTANAGGGGGGGGQAGSGNQPPRRTGGGVPPANERRYVPDEVVIALASTLTTDQANVLARRHRLVRLQSFASQLSGTTIARLRIPDRRSVPAVVRALEADSVVLSAQPNYLFTLSQEPQPVAFSEGDPGQYALAKLNLPQAHKLAKGDKVRIAIIDSGVDLSHPDLAGDIAESFDAVQKGDKVHAHGTAVAGVIGAHGRLLGAAPKAQLLPVRAFSGSAGDDGTTYAIVAGLNWAAARGARIINMSFAGPQDPEIARNLAGAHRKGIILVAAVGNKGPQSPTLYPAGDANVIAVTATNDNDQLPQFANRGRHIAVAAPGVDLMMLAPNGQLQFSSGTSFSAPYVTGIIALMLEVRPDLTPDEVKKTLMATARDLGPKGFDPLYGAGLADAYKALISIKPAAVETAGR